MRFVITLARCLNRFVTFSKQFVWLIVVDLEKGICLGTNFLSPLSHCTFLFSIRSEILLFEDVIFNY